MNTRKKRKHLCPHRFFCNPGIDKVAYDLSMEEINTFFISRQCGDSKSKMTELGKLRGTVRISFGIASNFHDAYRFLEFAKSFRE